MHIWHFFASACTAIFQRSSAPSGLDADAAYSSAAEAPPPTGPLCNVDGTPMLNDFVDVTGKIYGDLGPTYSCDSGDACDMGMSATDW